MSWVRLRRTPILCFALLATLAVASSAPAETRGSREGFVVQPFANTKAIRLLDHLQFGLPALVAERLAQHAPLRFVGPPELVSRAAAVPASARWILTGSFERRPDWRIAVTVEVRAAAAPQEIVAQATKEGPKDEVPRTTIDAALTALAGVPGLALPPAPASVTAPFSRDPYAFVLYGRGLGIYSGNGSPAYRAEKSLEFLKRAMVIDPKVPEVRRLVGWVNLQAGRPGHARAMWTYAIDVRPDYAACLAALAALDRTAGLPAARERYAKLLELDPDDLEARRVYGEVLSEAGQLPEAQAQLERVLEAAPNDLRARRALALVLASRRAGRELATELETLVKLDPENLDARLDLAAAYLSVGMGNEASATYEEVLKRRPRHAGALKMAADLARTRGDVKKAATYYAKLRWITPQDPRPVFLMAAAHYEAGNLEMAERLFTEASQFPGMLGEAFSNLGAIALRRGEAKQALWFLSRASKRRPGRAVIRFNHALALHKLGRSADALNELKAAEGADPGDAQVRFFAGVVCLRLGLLQEAELHFREALRLQPNHADARHNVALLEPLVNPRDEGSVSFINGVPLTPPPPPPEQR